MQEVAGFEISVYSHEYATGDHIQYNLRLWEVGGVGVGGSITYRRTKSGRSQGFNGQIHSKNDHQIE